MEQHDITAWLARPEWMEDASCRGLDPDLFYPDRGTALEPIRRICNACPVQAECLDYSMINGEHYGIWGGVNERERRRLRRTVATPSPAPSREQRHSDEWLAAELEAIA